MADKHPQIIITFEEPHSIVARVEYRDMEPQVLASQLMFIGQWLLLLGQEAMKESIKARQQQGKPELVVPVYERPPDGFHR